ncbi:hypothetical protein MDA_GLEAN10025767 [Myotis davidii]|uniref:Uncharacterized protein n=1 Tax=Myotis davidii TaxID=225400 RepID=L5LQS1_MYODS|nr:hypothetical protein MDA_GLEAN10025767 [Myotis davidii]
MPALDGSQEAPERKQEAAWVLKGSHCSANTWWHLTWETVAETVGAQGARTRNLPASREYNAQESQMVHLLQQEAVLGNERSLSTSGHAARQPPRHVNHQATPTTMPRQPLGHVNHWAMPATGPRQPPGHANHHATSTTGPRQPLGHTNHHATSTTGPCQPLGHTNHQAMSTTGPYQPPRHVNHRAPPTTGPHQPPGHANQWATSPVFTTEQGLWEPAACRI